MEIPPDLIETITQGAALLGISSEEWIRKAVSEKHKAGKKTSYPDDFTITEDMRIWFEGKKFTFDILQATEDWAASMRSNTKKYRYSNWAKAWQNGMVKHAQYQGRSQKRTTTAYQRFENKGESIIERSERIRQERIRSRSETVLSPLGG